MGIDGEGGGGIGHTLAWTFKIALLFAHSAPFVYSLSLSRLTHTHTPCLSLLSLSMRMIGVIGAGKNARTYFLQQRLLQTFWKLIFLSFTFAAAIECCDAVVISATYHFMVTEFIWTNLTVCFCIGFDTASKITYFWWQLKC